MMAGEDEQQQQLTTEQQTALDALSQLAAQGSAQGELPADPIGGFFATTGEVAPDGTPIPASPVTPQGEFLGPWKQQTPNSIGGAYHEGDNFSVLQSMNTEQLARFQDSLVANGLVREVVPGRIDDNTVKGMGMLMALGNRQAVTWQSVMEGITRAGGVGGDGGAAEGFEPPTYLAPDYATLAQRVKGMFREQLGRDPDQGEMAQFTAELQGWDKQNFNAQVAARRAEAEGEGGGTMQSVDPVARFQERFEKVYRHERDFVEDKQTAVESRQQVEASTGLLSAMSQQGGG